jgi:hypothetical protein
LQRPVDDGAVSTSVAARYWRALASANVTMSGRVPRALQLKASDRARTLYLALGQPRRAFSSLVLLASYRMALHQVAAAQEAADEARSLMQPEWPAMLRVRLLRMDGHLARLAGRPTEALVLYRDAVRVSVSTCDWLLEMMARENLTDLLWETGPIEDAAREALSVVDELRERPLTELDMAHPFAMAIGILSEMGRLDEASALACEALPLMRHAREPFVEKWVYLFWRRGQFCAATRLLGAVDADRGRFATPLQENERRLLAEARPALEALLPPEAFASALAAGAILDIAGVFALIADALAQRDEDH